MEKRYFSVQRYDGRPNSLVTSRIGGGTPNQLIVMLVEGKSTRERAERSVIRAVLCQIQTDHTNSWPDLWLGAYGLLRRGQNAELGCGR